MKRQLETFIAACLAAFRHLSRRNTIVASAVSITALGCLQEEVISNMMPEDTDFDGDGIGERIDCDDTDPAIGAPPSGQACEDLIEDCQPCDPDCNSEIISCNPIPDGDSDGYHGDVDCNDLDPDIYPGAVHESGSDAANRLEAMACDLDRGIDADCDGEEDFYCVIVNPPHRDDMDMDGYFAEDDCDDSNPLVYPDATYDTDSESARTLRDTACEQGAPLDVDCDGEPDYECDIIVNPPPPEPADLDGDGYTEDVDCNDEEELIHPDAAYEPDSESARYLEELACEDGPVDANCDLEPDYFCVIVNPPPPEGEDEDMDGFPSDVDCDDTSALIYPGAVFRPGSREARELEDLACQRGEAIDVDCDGEDDIDCMISINPLPDGDDRE